MATKKELEIFAKEIIELWKKEASTTTVISKNNKIFNNDRHKLLDSSDVKRIIMSEESLFLGFSKNGDELATDVRVTSLSEVKEKVAQQQKAFAPSEETNEDEDEDNEKEELENNDINNMPYYPDKNVKRMLKWVKGGMRYLYLAGRKGSGKTESVNWLAKEIVDFYNKKYETNEKEIKVYKSSGGDEVSISQIIGGDSLKDGEVYFKDGPLLKAMKHGLNDEGEIIGPPAFYLIDEFAALDSRVALEMNYILGNPSPRIEYCYQDGKTILAHPDFKFFATGNTVGKGLSSKESQYTAQAGVMDYSTMTRFQAFFDMKYSLKAEESIMKAAGLDKVLIDNIQRFAEELRSQFEEEQINNDISTRDIKNICTLYSICGNMGEAIYHSFFLQQHKEEQEIMNNLALGIFGKDILGTYGK